MSIRDRAVPAGGPDLPLVTIVIPAYQYEAYIGRSIDSALAMDWPADRLEILVVDDGSTDGTAGIVAGYLVDDRATGAEGDRGALVRYLHQENQGVVAAVSRGMREARGELIGLLAADDECTPDRLRRSHAVLAARPEVTLVYGNMEVIDADGGIVAPSFAHAAKLRPFEGAGVGDLLEANRVSGGPSLFRASLVEHVLPMPPEAPYEDWWLALKAAELGEIAYIPEPIYRYRHHGANMNLGAPPEQLAELCREELVFRRWLLGGQGVDLSAVSADHLRAAIDGLDKRAALVADKDRSWMHAVLPVTAGDELAADAALAEGDPVRALSFHPGHAGARAALGCPEPDPQPLETRATVTLAHAAEIVEHPELLETYAAVVGPDDDATLVLHAPGAVAEQVLAHLMAVAPLLVADDAPDVLLCAEPPSWATERTLLDRATACLTHREAGVAGLPRFQAGITA